MYTEDELLKGCLRNSRKHQHALYERYAGRMFSVCKRYAKNDAEAEDFLQEGFVRVFEKLAHFRSEGSLEGWIRRVIINTALQQIRSQRTSPFTEDDIDDIRPIAIMDDTLEEMSAKEIAEVINRLPNGYKTIFNLYVVEEFSHKEIAEQLGISEGTSKSQLARARGLLQKLIKKNENNIYTGSQAAIVAG